MGLGGGGSAGRTTFEIQRLRQDRWVTETVRDTEQAARETAKGVFADKSCAGVRVVRNWAHGDGTISETVIAEQTRTVRDDGPMRINKIEDAPPRCQKLEEYFSIESRATMGRVFHTYLEKLQLTPTEILHQRKELQRLQDKDTLVPSAIDAVATLQTAGTELSAKDRREEMFAALNQITAKARATEKKNLPKLGEKFSGLIATLAKSADADYLAMTVLARTLSGTPNWLGKLGTLCKLAEAETDAHALELLDTVIADVLGTDVIQEILGPLPSLASAIIGLIDLADGQFDPNTSDSIEVAEALNHLFAAHKLPASARRLIDRALRQLRSAQPLCRHNPAKELEEYGRVLTRLLLPGSILAGAQAAEALTLRGTRFVEQGGNAGRRTAITNTVHALPDRARGVMYLSELTKTDLAKDHLNDIIEQLDGVFSTRVIDELCRRSLTPKERLITATGAINAARSSALPEELKEQVSRHIDTVLERYLVDEKIIDRLDDPAAPLRDRAVRLVKFCGAGVLPEGRALNRARQRVVDLLRQPKFDQQFVEGISDPEKAAESLRAFHTLLVQSGFGG